MIAAVCFAVAFLVLYFWFPDTYNEMFTAKFRGENDSGHGRIEHGLATSEAEQTFALLNRLFGIGFGYHYGGVFFAILVNTGWIGMTVYLYAFLKPVILLPPYGAELAFKVCIATLFILFFISVSELFLPTTWMFLGISYWYLDRAAAERARTSRSSAIGANSVHGRLRRRGRREELAAIRARPT